MGRLTFRLNEKQEEDMRTKYLHFKYFPIPDYDLDRGNPGRITNDMIYNKLGELEDLEEELGIPLEILKPNQKVSFIKDNIIYNNIEIMGINIQNKEIMLGNSWSFTSLPLNLYGKTWWLKEDRSE